MLGSRLDAFNCFVHVWHRDKFEKSPVLRGSIIYMYQSWVKEFILFLELFDCTIICKSNTYCFFCCLPSGSVASIWVKSIFLFVAGLLRNWRIGWLLYLHHRCVPRLVKLNIFWMDMIENLPGFDWCWWYSFCSWRCVHGGHSSFRVFFLNLVKLLKPGSMRFEGKKI